MGNAPDAIGRGSDSAPYFHVCALHHNYHKTSYFSVSKSNPLIHNRTRNKNQSPQNGKSFCGD